MERNHHCALFFNMKPSEYNYKIKLSIDSNGYHVFCDKEHPLSYYSNSIVYYHRHKASIKLGRWIRTDEHVHHIDENKLNNSFDNLLILTASEHAKLHNQIQEKCCIKCGNKFTSSGNYCSYECTKRKTKIQWPSVEKMKEWIWKEPTAQIAISLRVSDNAVAKFCKKNNINKPPRGYWGFSYS